MSVILILIGASLFVAIGFLVSFIWAVRTGQYEDKYTPSVRMLFDDEVHLLKKEKRSETKTGTGQINEPSGISEKERPENEKLKVLK